MIRQGVHVIMQLGDARDVFVARMDEDVASGGRAAVVVHEDHSMAGCHQ